MQLREMSPKCKYVEIFTHNHVGSIGAPSRRTVFVGGTSAEQREFPESAGRNTKANGRCKIGGSGRHE
jgi:hypothetical protein